MQYDLTIPGTTELLEKDLAEMTDDNSAFDNPPRHSWRVSPSNLGGDCVAQLWYKYRWAKLVKIGGKLARLFQVGHDAEPKLVAILRRMGWTVWDEDPARKGKPNPQYNVKDFDGHLSGYLDGIGSHPLYTMGVNVNLEFKTSNDKNFAILKSKGVRIWQPKYYTQACLYMFYYNLPWTLFMVENKNTSEIVFRIVMRDDGHAREKLAIGHTVVNSRSRPAKIAMSAAHHKCKFCDFVDQCHYDQPCEKSCRACRHGFAAPGGEWGCDRYGSPIPANVVVTGCDDFTSI